MKYAFILNPAAGKGRDPSPLIALIETFAREKGLDYVLRLTEGPGHGKILAEEAVKQGVDCVTAIGGDGTINEIARAVMKTPASLGIIPKGSGNGFAREFGFPLEPRAALETLLRSRPLAIDVGTINDEHFFNVAGFGLDASIGRAFNQSQKGGHRGILPYFLIGLRQFASYKPRPAELSYDGKSLSLSPLLVAIAKGRQYGSGAVIAPDAVVNDGMLRLVIVDPAPWWRLVRHLPAIFGGTFRRAPFLRILPVKECGVAFDEEAPYHLDGEIRTAKRLQVSVEPGALTLQVPPDYRVR